MTFISAHFKNHTHAQYPKIISEQQAARHAVRVKSKVYKSYCMIFSTPNGILLRVWLGLE